MNLSIKCGQSLRFISEKLSESRVISSSIQFEFTMIRQILNRITLEPLIFLFTFGMVILDGAQIQTNLLLWKICHLELNYTEDICSNLTLDENNATMIEVQERANSFLMISEWLSSAPAFVWCLFSGKIINYFTHSTGVILHDSMQVYPL